ncbi:tRNA -methyltransferase catalytic subunit trm61 [Erysiphe neolycopersici]|uniref:tRNA (adenine(58)-N(1))-methyltransferase catalytic subunit TRM61 n=1 Tax=Erysiphe neolycopersici TaxID=212602 RepID=A0A420HJT9_9PEZI|nr:tRNA -methyltransferase catalytic subunit trm61 [Erysiphe neolycopersici]
MAQKLSPFLFPGSVSTANQLAIVHVKRDLQIPVILREYDEDDEGYAEGKVLNTRFGNFPHSTLIGLPWGSQVRASKVDTGSRGRRTKINELKRKRDDSSATDLNYEKIKEENIHDMSHEAEASSPKVRVEKEAVAALTGFVHLLPPTPENWTSSLPHRTQVVYTPDYSYILHRLRARPGSRLIEAGAGSGSFTHASARAIFNGYPEVVRSNSDDSVSEASKFGKVWSYEFHEQRFEKLQKEIEDHGLKDIVQIVYRDVCTEGFLINEQTTNSNDGLEPKVENISNEHLSSSNSNENLIQARKSPLASAVFLDLPAPWLALPHLTRSPPIASNNNNLPLAPTSTSTCPGSFISALDPSVPVHICTFSPCIEQVQRTVSSLRRLGWVAIEIVELSQKRHEIRRERVGLSVKSAQKSSQITPANVEEAVSRLIEVERTTKAYHEKGTNAMSSDKSVNEGTSNTRKSTNNKQCKENPCRRENIIKDLVENKSYMDGRLVHRTEAEVKTHTSYLVFAVLPQEWNEEDESKARKKWPLPMGHENGCTDVETKL